MDRCALCDLPVPDPPLTDPDLDGEYCCNGCIAVAKRVGTLENNDESTRDLDPKKNHEKASGDTNTTFISIHGMHCTSCETLVESETESIDGVKSVESNYSSGMMKIEYSPGENPVDRLKNKLSRWGYAVDPETGSVFESNRETIGRLLIAGFFGMMIMVWYILFLYPSYLGYSTDVLLMNPESTAFRYTRWNIAALTSIVLFYSGYPILRGALVSVKTFQPNMDLLIALATLSAYLYSVVTLLGDGHELYFDISVVVVFVVGLGRYYKGYLQSRASETFKELVSREVDRARIVENEETEIVDSDSLNTGDRILVKQGERIPADGQIVEGTASIDESLITGESNPVIRGVNDQVIGGSMVTENAVTVEVQSDTSTLKQVQSLLWDIQSSTPGLQRIADRIATYFVPAVLLLSFLSALYVLNAHGSTRTAFLTALTVLIVSCPCALGLATPLAIGRSLKSALERGILISSSGVFEISQSVGDAIFDKTGTLTAGKMRINKELGNDRALRFARILESKSSHPVGEAIGSSVNASDYTIRDFCTEIGLGVEGSVNNTQIRVGHPRWFDRENWIVPDEFQQAATKSIRDGQIPVFVGLDDRVKAFIEVGDHPRTDWESVFRSLSDSGIQITVLTGDNSRATQFLQDSEYVDDVISGASPSEKERIVSKYGNDEPVVMIGDGTNDAPALARADIGIAFGNRVELPVRAADIILTQDKLSHIPRSLDLITDTRLRIRQNLAWGFLYNVVAIPSAITGFLNPLIAAVAMSLSSLLVVLNSLRSYHR